MYDSDGNLGKNINDTILKKDCEIILQVFQRIKNLLLLFNNLQVFVISLKKRYLCN